MIARASITAGIVAAFRSMGEVLPSEAQLARDSYGARLAGPWAERALEAVRRAPIAVRPLLGYVLYMQVRTRALDDVLLEFVARGGRQVVLMGAGFDARAHRFGDRLAGATVFEVDHPATQARKRAAVDAPPESVRVVYTSFDFEAEPVADLPDRLAAVGHDRAAPTLTIWEGVTMYLTEPAIEATLAAVRSYGGPSSLLAFTYFEKRRLIEQPRWRQRVVRRFVRTVGEPFRFGWDPEQLDPWLRGRGFGLISDRTEAELARSLLPPEYALRIEAAGRHVAVASVD